MEERGVLRLEDGGERGSAQVAWEMEERAEVVREKEMEGSRRRGWLAREDQRGEGGRARKGQRDEGLRNQFGSSGL